MTLSTLVFTGSRHDLPGPQLTALDRFIAGRQDGTAIHGCCTGGDHQFHELMRRMLPKRQIFGYRSTLPQWTMPIDPSEFAGLFGPAPPLERNRIMVRRADALVACPRTMTNHKGGTWFTIDYAVFSFPNMPVTIITPNGKLIDARTIVKR